MHMKTARPEVAPFVATSSFEDHSHMPNECRESAVAQTDQENSDKDGRPFSHEGALMEE